MPKLTAIVAMTSERIIGRDGTLPWHLPEDLAFFKRTTSGHTIVMGRTTYDSIGRPLPKRRNIVLTRDRNWQTQGVEVIHSVKELAPLVAKEEEVFLIGGAQVYAAFMDQLDEMLVSWVREAYPGDTRFPDFSTEFPSYEVVEEYETFEVRRYRRVISEKNLAAFRFQKEE